MPRGYYGCAQAAAAVAASPAADIGGISPGSMPPNSKLLVEEGAAIVSFKLVKNGHFQVHNNLCTCIQCRSFSGVQVLICFYCDWQAVSACCHPKVMLLQRQSHWPGLAALQGAVLCCQVFSIW